MNADGSGASQITRLATEASGETVSPDGKYLVVTSDVYPECGADDACNAKQHEADANNKVKARLITTLLYRHWTSWQGDTRSHLLSISLADGKAVDLTPGDKVVPPFSLGGPDDYAISPDGAEVCFSMNSDPVPAISTNNDLYVVPIGGGDAHKITANPGADNSPQYSPDGRYIAYRSQARAGYESDKWRLVVLDRPIGQTEFADRRDRPVGGEFHMGARFEAAVFRRGGSRTPGDSVCRGGRRRRGDGRLGRQHAGRRAVHKRRQDHGLHPAERKRSGRNMQGQQRRHGVPLTHLNDDLLNQYRLTPLEDFWTPARRTRRYRASS